AQARPTGFPRSVLDHEHPRQRAAAVVFHLGQERLSRRALESVSDDGRALQPVHALPGLRRCTGPCMKPGTSNLLRIGSNATRDVRLDWLWLIGFTLLLVGTGIGTRDPWPADEPRFALVV